MDLSPDLSPSPYSSHTALVVGLSKMEILVHNIFVGNIGTLPVY